MTTIFSIVLTIAVVIAVSLTIIILNHYFRQRKTEKLLAGFDKAAAEFNLSIAKQQPLGNRVIGYDDANNKLLYLARTGYKENGYLVDMEDVKSCTISKSYGPTKNSRTRPGGYLKTIALQLNYKNDAKPLLLPFYSNAIDPASEIMERMKHAKEWQGFLSESVTKSGIDLVKAKNDIREEVALYSRKFVLIGQ